MDIKERIGKGLCDEVELLEYITDNNIEIAIAAAQSPIASGPILDIAARDRDEQVRLAALNNPNISYRTLVLLSNDPNREIAEKAKMILGGNDNDMVLPKV